MKKFLISFILIIACFALSASVLKAAAPLDDDNDGLLNEQELIFKTDQNNPDSDFDGFKDGNEVDHGYDPLSATTTKLVQKIEIDLKQQKLYYLVNGYKWREFTISSGKKSTPTPKGEFKINTKIKKAWSRSYRLWMPYWLGLDKGRIGIHELPIWPNGYREGLNHLGTPVSHGCVRLGLKDAAYLYDRLEVGISVKIY